ncbi:MAG: co-chaperone GroES, partial [Candidatus Aminicenantes bacterium]|nr:co-chaperone GroES [Candidatus Aminicenantes bacterium]
MKVQPLDERVLIKPIEQEEKVGSIVIPDTAKE